MLGRGGSTPSPSRSRAAVAALVDRGHAGSEPLRGRLARRRRCGGAHDDTRRPRLRRRPPSPRRPRRPRRRRRPRPRRTAPRDRAPPTTTAPRRRHHVARRRPRPRRRRSAEPSAREPPPSRRPPRQAQPAPCSVERTLRPARSGAGVVCLERALIRRGHVIRGPDRTFDRDHRRRRAQAPAAHRDPRHRRRRTGDVVRARHLGRARPSTSACSVGRPRVAATRGLGARCVEQRLIQLGYDVRGPDSTFDLSAAVAIGAYERSQGFTITDRIAGPWTLRRLGIWSGPSLTVACTTSRPGPPRTTGPPARCLEQRLIQLGYPMWAPDRTFDAAATETLRQYQGRSATPPMDGPASSCSPRSGSGSSRRGSRARSVGRCDGARPGGPRCAWSASSSRSATRSTVRTGASTARASTRCGPTSGPRASTPTGSPVRSPSSRSASGPGATRTRRRPSRRTRDRPADRLLPVAAADLGGRGRRQGRQDSPRLRPALRAVRRHLLGVLPIDVHVSVADPDVKWRYMVRFAYGPGGGRIGFHEIPTRFGVPLQSESQLGQPLSGGCVRQRTSEPSGRGTGPTPAPKSSSLATTAVSAPAWSRRPGGRRTPRRAGRACSGAGPVRRRRWRPSPPPPR